MSIFCPFSTKSKKPVYFDARQSRPDFSFGKRSGHNKLIPNIDEALMIDIQPKSSSRGFKTEPEQVSDTEDLTTSVFEEDNALLYQAVCGQQDQRPFSSAGELGATSAFLPRC